MTVITGIGLDHTAFLGDTIEAIAAEKAGILKPGVPVVYGGDDTAVPVIVATAKEKDSPYHRVDYTPLRVKEYTLDGTRFDYAAYADLSLSLLGTYQPRNAAVVLTAVQRLLEQGLAIPEEAVRQGLANVVWPGRFEILSRCPLTIFDGAHNAQGIAAAVDSIRRYFGAEPVYVLTGVLADKDYRAIAADLATVAGRAFVLTPDNPRALAGETYAALLSDLGVPAEAYSTVEAAYTAAQKAAVQDGVPLVCLGSLYTYASL